jgi:competence protein ComEA
MLVLAGIGAYATAKGLAGHAVESAVASSVPRENSDPVAPVRSASTPRRAAVLPASGGEAPSAASREPEAKGPSPAMTEDGKVILNRAEPEDLMRLPGIGRKRAESIVELRAKLGGRFKRFTDLLRIRGIGPRRLKQMIPLMVLDPPAAAEPSREESNRG